MPKTIGQGEQKLSEKRLEVVKILPDQPRCISYLGEEIRWAFLGAKGSHGDGLEVDKAYYPLRFLPGIYKAEGNITCFGIPLKIHQGQRRGTVDKIHPG